VGRQGAGTRPGRQSAHADRALNDARLNELLRALAHEERRRILQACLVQAQAAGELAAASGLSPASVSEHLKVLRKTGLVVLERQGRFRLYRTDPSCVLAAVSGIEQVVSRRIAQSLLPRPT
jgi:DNA-binding transcriptional ArsR family regulator